MKLINASLLILGLTLAFLPTSHAQGVMSGSDATDKVEIEDALDFENEDEEFSFERLLARKMKQRCPFPGELKMKYDVRDACKEGKPLFKRWKWCKTYCYVCPCWDGESCFNFNGGLVECKRCKAIEILPANHFLCAPPCENVSPKPKDQFKSEYVCDAECPCEDKKCVAQGTTSCACKRPCALTKPTRTSDGETVCDGFCPPDFVGSCEPKGQSCECLYREPPPPNDDIIVKDECYLSSDGNCVGKCPLGDKWRCLPHGPMGECICSLSLGFP